MLRLPLLFAYTYMVALLWLIRTHCRLFGRWCPDPIHTHAHTHTHTLIHIRICTHTFVSCTHSPVTNLTRFCVLIGQWYALYGFDSPFSDQRMPTVSTAVPISMEGIVLQLFFIVIRYRVCACVGIA